MSDFNPTGTESGMRGIRAGHKVIKMCFTQTGKSKYGHIVAATEEGWEGVCVHAFVRVCVCV